MKFCFFKMRSVAIVAIVVIYSATCWSVPVRDVSNNAEATSIFDSHHATHKESVREARIKAGLQQITAENTDVTQRVSVGSDREAGSIGLEPSERRGDIGVSVGSTTDPVPCRVRADRAPCRVRADPAPCRVRADPAPCVNPCDVRPDPNPAPCRNPCRIKVIPVEMPSYPIGSSNSIIRESEQHEQFNTVPYRPIVVYPLGGSSSKLITVDEYHKQISAQQPIRPPTQPQLPCSLNIINPPADVQLLPSGPSPCISISNPSGRHRDRWNSQFNDRYFGLGGVDTGFSRQLGLQTNLFGSQISSDLSRYMSESERLAREQAQNAHGNQNSKFNTAYIIKVEYHRVIPLQIEIANPPPEQLDPDWVMVPDENGNFHLVNVELALNAPSVFAAFNPEMEVIFELYTRDNPHDAHILRPDDLGFLASSNFNPDRPTRFVCHGFNSDGELTQSFSRAYFQQGNHDVNFISVNWQAGSNHGYLSARTSVSSVGSYLARMIDFLVLDGRMKLKDVVLIGHSLGAHVVGIAGKHVSSGKVPLIVGLDPASPLFNYGKEGSRIAVGDAISVETIETNGRWLGFSAPLGDASFYPNGGGSQPGCGLDFIGSCSHSRAHEYYVESINSKTHFYGYPCESYDEIKQGTCTVIGEPQLMGGELGNREVVRGVFYLETAEKAPFALGRLNLA